jgi:hypothetical protein
MDGLSNVLLCQVSNEVEAAMVVNLLKEEGIPALSDSSPATPAFGGLPFESGHSIYVPAPNARRSREILSRYPHFHNLKNVHEPDA